jgi:hypothetical protein
MTDLPVGGSLQFSTITYRPFGATVREKAGNRTFTKYNDGKSGYLAQSVLPRYFGLGEAAKIDRIEIDWPSGASRS